VIVADARHPYTRMLFAATPEIDDVSRVRSIPGTPPRLDQPIAGCAFAPRCDVVLDGCRNQAPPLVDTAGHGVRCLRPGVRP
jgi:peptide/nickel transport system ATP-binding protein